MFIAPKEVKAQLDDLDADELIEMSNEMGHRYLQILDLFQQFETDDRVSAALRDIYKTNYAAFLSPNEVYTAEMKKIRHRFREPSTRSLIAKQALIGEEAVLTTLRNRIEDEKLVMINEHHFYPNHRKVMEALLPIFREAGFNYLAFEGVTPGQDSLLNMGYAPVIETGFYTRDPRFANMIRLAQSLDFTLVAYENTNPDEYRESAQASNLYERIFARNPDAKVLVYAELVPAWADIVPGDQPYHSRHPFPMNATHKLR